MSLSLRLRTSNFVASGATNRVMTADYFGLHIGETSATSIWADYDPNARNYPVGNYHQTPVPQQSVMPIGIARLWDANGCHWRNIERQKGVYSWSRLDEAVAAYEAAGITKIIYTHGCPPDWATAPQYGVTYYEQPGNPIGWHVGYNPHAPANVNDFGDFCAAVAARYAGRITHFEVWNEWNDSSLSPGVGYIGTQTKMLQLAQVMRDRIRAVYPAAVLLSPNVTGGGLTSGQAVNNLDGYLAAGGAQYADVISVHGYSDYGPQHQPESILAHGDVVRSIMRKHNVTKPVWNGEWGLSSYVNASAQPVTIDTPAAPLDGARGAAMIVRTLMCNWFAGYDNLTLFQLDWVKSIIQYIDLNNRATTMQPVTAWRYFAHLMTGGKLSLVGQPGANGASYYTARFVAGDGRKGLVVWLIDYPKYGSGLPVSVTIPTPEGVTEIRDVMGASVAVGSSITVTGSPKYIFGVN